MRPLRAAVPPATLGALALLLVLAGVLGMATSPLAYGALADKEFFRYAGMALGQGARLYVDFFDHKPPLIHAVAALSDPRGPGLRSSPRASSGRSSSSSSCTRRCFTRGAA
jgi:hypothetical protein